LEDLVYLTKIEFVKVPPSGGSLEIGNTVE